MSAWLSSAPPKQIFARSEIKLTSVPETDLELELGWLGLDPGNKTPRASRVSPPENLRPIDRLQPVMKSLVDIENYYSHNACWERQAQARFMIMCLVTLGLVLACVCSVIQTEEVDDFDFLITCIASLAFCVSASLRNSRRLWHFIQIFTSLIVLNNLAVTISSVYFDSKHPMSTRAQEKADSIQRMRRVFRVPLLTFTLIQVFAASGLPNKSVLLNGAVQMVACCVDNYMFLAYLFPDSALEVFPIVTLLALVGIVTLFTVYDHDKRKKEAYLQRVLSEQSDLGKLCEQEAAGTHKRRIVDYLNDSVCVPLAEIEETIQQFPVDQYEQTQALLSRVASRVSYVTDIMKDAVSVTRLESGGFEFHHHDFCLGQMILRSLELGTGHQDSTTPHKVQTDVDNSLVPLIVRGDLTQLTNVLSTCLLVACRSSAPNCDITFSANPIRWNISQQTQPTVAVRFEVVYHPQSPGDPATLLRSWQGSISSVCGLKLALGRGVIEKGHRGTMVAEEIAGIHRFVIEIDFPFRASGDVGDPPRVLEHIV